MPRQLQLEIAESAEALEKQLKHARTASQKERLQMLWWLKSGQVNEHQQLARQSGRDPSTITRWLQKYRTGGIAELLKVKSAPGKPPQMTPEALAGVKKRLSEEGFTSYGEIVHWIKGEYGITLSYAVVYDWVHYRLKAKLKVPRPQSAKQDQAAVERFKKTLLPR